MRYTHAHAALVLVLALGAGTTGCDLLGPNHESFTVRVESISAPETLAQGETLIAGFHGFVGPDGCHRLREVERARSPGRLELRFQGQRSMGRDILCTQEPILLDHEERVTPPLEDPFTIVVRQPGGGTLERVVRVE